jgi:hypothetical protein
MSRTTAWLLISVAMGSAAEAQLSNHPDELPVEPLQAVERFGHTNALILCNPKLDVVVLPSVGRFAIMRFADSGPVHRFDTNLLAASSARSTEAWQNFGGDWVWPVAQKRWSEFFGSEWPPARALDGAPWDCKAWISADTSSCCTLRRRIGPPLNIDVSRMLKLDPTAARITIRQRIERYAPSDVPVSLWSISQLADAEEIVLPVDAPPEALGLTLLGFAPPPKDMVARCESSRVVRVGLGTEHKLGSSSARTWIAGRRGRVLLLLRGAGEDPQGTFPDEGCAVEVYANKGLGYAELEILTPERLLAPGEHIENTVTIECHSLPTHVTSCSLAEIARRIVGETQLSPSPTPTEAGPSRL